MSEEEIIEIVQDYINYIRFKENARYSINQWFMAIEDLLDLYNKEKEKNQKILSDNIETFQKLFAEEISKIYINKDKIKEKIEERKEKRDTLLTEISKTLKIYTLYDSYELEIRILEELLESEE